MPPDWNCIEGLPVGSQGEVDQAVAVDVEGVDADVVVSGTPLNDDTFLPGRVLVPDDLVGVDDDDVLFAVVVDVGQHNGIADAQASVEFHAERRERRPGFGPGKD